MEPVARERNPLAETVYLRIVDALLAGDLTPGDHLVQEQLAEQLNLSRTPVRDALMRLAAEGLIVPQGRRGFAVRSLTESDLRENLEARMAIEGYAAAQAALTGDAAIAPIQAVIDEQQNCGFEEPERIHVAVRLVHFAIVESTGNQRLIEIHRPLWSPALVALETHQYLEVEPEVDFIAIHQPIVDAMRSGDPNAARASIEEFFHRAMSVFDQSSNPA